MAVTVIIDYGSGNLCSAANSFVKAAEGANQKIIVSSEASMLAEATHIVLPGVGAFGDCIRGLQQIPGMVEALQREVLQRNKWFLGICVGMQMMMQWGNEHGRHQGLCWIEGEVVAITPKDHSKVPHMGWNNLAITSKHPVFDGIKSGDHAYFVHSYHAQCSDSADVIATVEYGGQTLTAAIGHRNMIGTQFHPEKSQKTGLRLIENFVRMPPNTV